jgi:hypothetical protein
MTLCIERNCIRPATINGRCVLHDLPSQRTIRIKGAIRRMRGVIAEVCDVCGYPVESDQHLNHCRE